MTHLYRVRKRKTASSLRTAASAARISFSCFCGTALPAGTDGSPTSPSKLFSHVAAHAHAASIVGWGAAALRAERGWGRRWC